MGDLVELCGGRAPRAAPIAALSALLPLGAVAYVAWKVLERDDDTVYGDQLGSWLLDAGALAACVILLSARFWRTTRLRLALAAGVGLAVVACLTGLMVETLVTTL